MGKRLGTLLIAVGLIFISVAIYQYVDYQVSTRKALEEAENMLRRKLPQAQQPADTMTSTGHEPDLPVYTEREDFEPKDDDVVGILNIPKLDAELPIIEGTEEEMLAKGVGHYTKSVFPSDGEQILLSGHRDTVFRNFGLLEIGDRFIVELPYGKFEYEIKETKIVDEDDRTVIRPMGEEVLTVSTCYPFRFIGNAPQRYIVYAYPVTLNNSLNL